MTARSSWDPDQYLRFGDERLRPALDLLAHINLQRPSLVVDLGCGAGNISAILKHRFPDARVLGVDGSAAMLEKARAAAPDCEFVQADMAHWTPEQPPDLIYSNAALHWLPDHQRLFPRLIGMVASGGVLAVQMPAMHDSPMRRLQGEVAASGAWAERLHGIASARDILKPEEYWTLLRPHAVALDMWETIYLHPLQGEDAVTQWATGSSLRPFLDALEPGQREAFRKDYADAVRPHYPRQPDGTTLFPFRRLFMVATRS